MRGLDYGAQKRCWPGDWNGGNVPIVGQDEKTSKLEEYLYRTVLLQSWVLWVPEHLGIRINQTLGSHDWVWDDSGLGKYMRITIFCLHWKALCINSWTLQSLESLGRSSNYIHTFFGEIWGQEGIKRRRGETGEHLYFLVKLHKRCQFAN